MNRRDARTWTEDLRDGVRHAGDLARLPLAPGEGVGSGSVRIPAGYLDLIDWNDPRDPIRAQVVPRDEELRFDAREREDPIGDLVHAPVPRLTHRYPDRVLLYPTYRCAVYCRHCFRKEALGAEGFSRSALEPAFSYIASRPELREVILTGGDPLLLPDDALAWIRARLEAVPHVRMLRIHTRIPVVLPSRITPELIEALSGPRMVAIVTHFNHPREITPATAVAAEHLRRAGFMLLNQSVLLRGVNDDVEVLEALFRELVCTLGARPYYLHHCDLARGLAHFRVPIAEGRALMRALRGRVSGICLPTYVLDLPGGDGKVAIEASSVEAQEATRWLFRTWRGGVHAYEEVLPDEGA